MAEILREEVINDKPYNIVVQKTLKTTSTGRQQEVVRNYPTGRDGGYIDKSDQTFQQVLKNNLELVAEEVYKLFLLEDGKIKNLFHGVPREDQKRNSRTIPLDKWIKAEKKQVRDGSESPYYLSGIHVLKEKDHVEDYRKNFYTDKNRVVVKCLTAGLRQKPTNDRVYLADWLYVPQETAQVVIRGD